LLADRISPRLPIIRTTETGLLAGK